MSNSKSSEGRNHHSENDVELTQRRNCIHNLKFVLVGQMGVGKTALAQRFAAETFNERQAETIGAAFHMRSVQIGENFVNFEIWVSQSITVHFHFKPMCM